MDLVQPNSPPKMMGHSISSVSYTHLAHRYPSGYHLGVGGPVYADAREAGCFQAEEAGAVYLAGSFLPRRVSRPKGGIFHGLYHEMPFRCPEIPFLLLVAVIASASDGKNGERIACLLYTSTL